MVKVLDITYEPSQSVLAQGKEVNTMEKRGYNKIRGGNGTYIMGLPPKITLYFEVDGKRMSASVKSLIREIYSPKRLTEKQANRFFQEVKSGKIKLQYSEQSGLTIE